MSQRSIEVRVGILILVALGLLGAFIVVMGGLSFEPTYTVYVDFDNPGGLQTGAPVRISGVKVGRVSSVEFRGGQVNPKTKEREPLIRVVASLENKYKNSIFENSRWFVTTQGVLGEMFLAVDPGTPDRPVLKDGAVVQGISPPRLDLLLSETYELLHRAYVGITENEDKLAETFDGLHRTLKGTGDFFEKNSGKIDRVVDNVETLSIQANETVAAARERYVDGPQATRIMNNVDGVTASMNENLGPLLADSRKAARDMARLTDTLASERQLEEYAQTMRDIRQAAKRANAAASDAQALLSHVKQGRGTVGAFVMDEAVYDDVQELLRDLKHNPWKLFWKD